MMSHTVYNVLQMLHKNESILHICLSLSNSIYLIISLEINYVKKLLPSVFNGWSLRGDDT